MNLTKEKFNDWLEGKLSKAEAEMVESYIESEQNVAIDLFEETSTPAGCAELFSAEIQPPYPDFFNQKLANSIASSSPQHERSEIKENVVSAIWQRLLYGSTALAVLVATFFVGMQFNTQPQQEADLVYVPSEQVTVTRYQTEEATMILLDGLEPLEGDLFTPVSHIKEDEQIQMITISNNSNELF